jgi:Na+/melibiose symporter-like transporter
MVTKRNGFTYMANIIVLVIALILFVLIDDPVKVFSLLTCICLLIGLCSTMWYIVNVKENPLS